MLFTSGTGVNRQPRSLLSVFSLLGLLRLAASSRTYRGGVQDIEARQTTGTCSVTNSFAYFALSSGSEYLSAITWDGSQGAFILSPNAGDAQLFVLSPSDNSIYTADTGLFLEINSSTTDGFVSANYMQTIVSNPSSLDLVNANVNAGCKFTATGHQHNGSSLYICTNILFLLTDSARNDGTHDDCTAANLTAVAPPAVSTSCTIPASNINMRGNNAQYVNMYTFVNNDHNIGYYANSTNQAGASTFRYDGQTFSYTNLIDGSNTPWYPAISTVDQSGLITSEARTFMAQDSVVELTTIVNPDCSIKFIDPTQAGKRTFFVDFSGFSTRGGDFNIGFWTLFNAYSYRTMVRSSSSLSVEVASVFIVESAPSCPILGGAFTIVASSEMSPTFGYFNNANTSAVYVSTRVPAGQQQSYNQLLSFSPNATPAQFSFDSSLNQIKYNGSSLALFGGSPQDTPIVIATGGSELSALSAVVHNDCTLQLGTVGKSSEVQLFNCAGKDISFESFDNVSPECNFVSLSLVAATPGSATRTSTSVSTTISSSSFLTTFTPSLSITPSFSSSGIFANSTITTPAQATTAVSVTSKLTTTAVTTPSRTSASSPQTGAPVSTFRSIGCVRSRDQFVGFTSVLTSAQMTPALCQTACSTRLYAGVSGNNCYCADALSAQTGTQLAGTGQCNTPCPGDSTQSCGGLSTTSKLRARQNIPNTVLLSLFENIALASSIPAVATVPGTTGQVGTQVANFGSNLVIVVRPQVYVAIITVTYLEVCINCAGGVSTAMQMIVTTYTCTANCTAPSIPMATITQYCSTCGVNGQGAYITLIRPAAAAAAAATGTAAAVNSKATNSSTATNLATVVVVAASVRPVAATGTTALNLVPVPTIATTPSPARVATNSGSKAEPSVVIMAMIVLAAMVLVA